MQSRLENINASFVFWMEPDFLKWKSIDTFSKFGISLRLIFASYMKVF